MLLIENKIRNAATENSSTLTKGKRAAGLSLLALFFLLSGTAFGQTEVAPWGNITGIRVDGQLMAFETSLRVVGKDWSEIKSTAKEQQRPKYTRNGTKQLVTTRIDSIYFTQEVEDIKTGQAKVTVQVAAKAAANQTGVFFGLNLPVADYAGGTVEFIKPQNNALHKISLSVPRKEVQGQASGVRFTSKHQQLEILFAEPTVVVIKAANNAKNQTIPVYVSLLPGNAQNGQTAQKIFTLQATGEIDKSPIHLTLNTAQSGRVFEGLGGNFRLQNLKTDPQVIDYSLQNLRVAWGRVEMPWRFWQPEIGTDPIVAAKAGKLHPNVQRAMEMAQRLSKMGIPVILSAWSGPRWAIEGEPKFRPGPDGVWGNPLSKTNINATYKSIADYVLYLKENYGVEVKMFSFNESDLGINIRQTGLEHADFIKGMGAHFAARGLPTKLLLGDNSDATTYEFIYPAMADPGAIPYIGAISFHSWRGWEKETLEKWAEAAKKLNLPLIVGEGSIDAAAWNYPDIFEEQTYALEEINLYTRLLAICQPLTILQWQLTADYSPLAGGGIFGNNEPLRPTQRFWNLKQLASTPEKLAAMPLTTDRSDVSCAALGNNSTGKYAVHLVNNGSAREVILTGLPKQVKSLQLYMTDKKSAMAKGKRLEVKQGQIKFNVPATSYTSLFSE